MKNVSPLVLAACLAGSFGMLALSAQQGAVFKDGQAEAIFRGAQAAVGHGEGKVVGLRTIVAKGKSKVVVGEGDPVDAQVEIRVLLPDHYLRIDTAGTSRMLTGFAGKTLLTAMEDGGQRSTPPQNLHEGLLKVEQARLARLLLGATAYVSPHYFITFRSTGAVQGMANPLDARAGSVSNLSASEDNVIEGAGRDNFFVRLFVGVTRLPMRMEYRASKDRMNTIVFADRREVDGLRIPFRITTSDAKRTIDDVILEQVVVNGPLTPADFAGQAAK